LGPVAGTGAAASIASSCRKARVLIAAVLQEDNSGKVGKDLQSLSSKLDALQVSTAWKMRIARYRRALSHEAGVEEMLSKVSGNEVYPRRKLIAVRESELNAAAGLLKIPECALRPL
jgi:hypothetical protein